MWILSYISHSDLLDCAQALRKAGFFESVHMQILEYETACKKAEERHLLCPPLDFGRNILSLSNSIPDLSLQEVHAHVWKYVSGAHDNTCLRVIELRSGLARALTQLIRRNTNEIREIAW